MHVPLQIPLRSRGIMVPEPPVLCPSNWIGLERPTQATWSFLPDPGSGSGGKGPTKHPGFIVPQKEGTNYLPTLWGAQGENRGQWCGEGGNWGSGVVGHWRRQRESHRIHFKVSLAIWG